MTIVNTAISNFDGLVSGLQGAFADCLDIDISKDSVLNTEDKPVHIGGGTDGASVNVGIHPA